MVTRASIVSEAKKKIKLLDAQRDSLNLSVHSDNFMSNYKLYQHLTTTIALEQKKIELTRRGGSYLGHTVMEQKMPNRE